MKSGLLWKNGKEPRDHSGSRHIRSSSAVVSGRNVKLLEHYQYVTRKYAAAVTELRQKMGTLSMAEYDALYRMVATLMRGAAAARSKLQEHVFAHCFGETLNHTAADCGLVPAQWNAPRAVPTFRASVATVILAQGSVEQRPERARDGLLRHPQPAS
jgi:hypothetical protein